MKWKILIHNQMMIMKKKKLEKKKKKLLKRNISLWKVKKLKNNILVKVKMILKVI